jgi:hypothetical protein
MACKRSAVRSRLAPPDFRRFDARLASPSSRGRGHIPFTDVTGVRIPVGTPFYVMRLYPQTLPDLHHCIITCVVVLTVTCSAVPAAEVFSGAVICANALTQMIQKAIQALNSQSLLDDL